MKANDRKKDDAIQSRRLLRGVRKNDLEGHNSGKSNLGKYASDNEYVSANKHSGADRISSAATCSTGPVFKKSSNLPIESTGEADSTSAFKPTKPQMTRPFRVQEEYKFKWVKPEKVFDKKYGKTKVKILHDINAYKHHQTHKLNVFFDQFNEFVRIVFKN